MAVRENIETWSRWASIGWTWTRLAFLLQCVYFVVCVGLSANVETLGDLINALGAYSLRTLGHGLSYQFVNSLFVGALAVVVDLLRELLIEIFETRRKLAAIRLQPIPQNNETRK